MTRASPHSPRRAPAKRANRPSPIFLIAGAVIMAALLFWLFRPSPLSKVTNLGSRGTAVIAFGDSITAGYGASSGADYPARLGEMTGVAVVNAGVSGDTTESALARIETDVLTRDPRIVIVGLGGNDYLRGVEMLATEATLRSIVRRVQGGGAMVVLLGFNFPARGANYEAMYERIAEEEGCLLVPGVMKGILTNPSLKSDQIHPNDRGYELIASRVEAPLKKLMRKADSARGR